MATSACIFSAVSSEAAVTLGLPSRSPPTHVPMRRNGGTRSPSMRRSMSA